MIRRRASGILLHVSSLPSQFGIGDLGPDAYEWVDFLVKARQSLWQVLPLNPTTEEDHHSPYQAASGLAGNPLFISPSLLREQNLLSDDDFRGFPSLPDDRVDYREVSCAKRRLLDLAYDRFEAGAPKENYHSFCARNASWLDDYAAFVAIRGMHPNLRWQDWPAPLKDRTPSGMRDVALELRDGIGREKFFQYLFFEQWGRLKRHANERGVQIVGDLPFYVGRDSADVWANPSLFKLDESKRPTALAGVPPDAFSETGQLWGSPVYEWVEHAKAGYSWWIERMRMNLGLFDIVRIDHFRAFSASWEVPAGQETAAEGRWVDGPSDDFFQALLRRLPFPAVIAEDLGFISADVRELIRRYRIPGMKVLLFAFDGAAGSNPYLCHNHTRNCVVYTGTHDNNTTRGWFETEADPEQKRRLADYLGAMPSATTVSWDMIRLAMMSVCRFAIIPMQDALSLDAGARMNRPAVAEGNWQWRLKRGLAGSEPAARLARLAEICGRA